jgi:hypothetical protein
MTKSTAAQLTVLTTVGVLAVKTYTKTAKGIDVKGYGRAKNFTAETIDVDDRGKWLRRLRGQKNSFVVLGAPKDWKRGERKRRLSSNRDDSEATIEDVARGWMPIDVDAIDFTPFSDIDDGEGFALELLDRLGLRGTRCVWHLTNSHGFFDRYRARLWIELETPMTAAQMKAYAKERWGEERVEVDGKMKAIVDLAVYQCQQPIYTGDPVLVGIDDPVTRRVGFVDGDALDVVPAGSRSKRGEADDDDDDDNIRKLDDAGLYIRRLKPGQHCIVCPWEDEHSGEEREDDTFYFQPHYNGHDIPAFKCHHGSCEERKWADVLEAIGEPAGWVYIKRIGKFHDPRDGELVDIAAYAAEQGWSNDRQVVRRFLKAGGESVDRVEFLPGQERVVEARGVRTLNTYVDLRIAPDRNIDSAPWAEQLGFLLPDADERRFLCDWMAHAYQHPGRKINWAPVLFGPEGNGKTSVLAALGRCIGYEYEHVPTSDELKDKFTGWAHGKLLVRIEELMSGEGRYEIANRLKPIITNTDVSVRRMHREGFKARNYANVCASTNHINSIPVEDGDRRYAVLRTVGDEDLIRSNVGRLKRLHRWLYQEDGLRAVAAWLADRDVSQFDYSGHAPQTEIKDSMQDASANVLTRATQTAKDLAKLDVVTGSMLIDYLRRQDQEIDTYRSGHIAAALNWMPMNRAVAMKKNRNWIGDRQEPVWSPTRNREALQRFNTQTRSERATYANKVLREAGPPRPVFSVVRDGASSATGSDPDEV